MMIIAATMVIEAEEGETGRQSSRHTPCAVSSGNFILQKSTIELGNHQSVIVFAPEWRLLIVDF